MTIENILLAGRATLVEPALTEGQTSALSLNADGRLRVASKQGYFPPTSGPVNALAGALAVDVTDASNLVLHVRNTGTAPMTAGAWVFEGSIDSTDGVDGTWFSVQAVRTNANTPETGTGTLNITNGLGLPYAWEASVNAVRWFRVRCTTAITASAIALWTAIRGSYATEPIPAIQTHAVTQSGTWTTQPLAATGHTLLTAATTNAGLVKAAAGSIYELSAFNPTAAIVYLKLYNKASAPTVGTDVPIMTVPVPVNGLVNLDLGASGKRFSAGIAVAVTAGPLATDTAVVAAGAQIHFTYA